MLNYDQSSIFITTEIEFKKLNNFFQIKFNFFCDTITRPLTEVEHKILENCKEPVIISYKLLHIDTICYAIFSAADPLFCHYKDCAATCFGLIWPEAMEILELTADQVWGDITGKGFFLDKINLQSRL